MHKKKLILFCQQILSDANRVQYNRACFLSERYALYIIANKDVSEDVRKKAEVVYSFPINQKLGRVLFPFWYLWILVKIRTADATIRHIYSTYEPRNIILAFFAKIVFRFIWTVDLWDDPEKALMLAKAKSIDKWRIDVLFKTIEFFIAKRVIKFADNIIISLVPGRITKKYSLPTRKILAVTNGINLGYDFKGSIREDTHRSDRFTLFYCGTVDKIRLEGLLACMREVVQIIPKIKIIIIGMQEPKGYRWLETSFKELENEIDLEISGVQPYKLVVQAINESDVCICPYPDKLDLGTAYPVKIFDYMYLGKPVVASRLPGIEKIVTHGIDGLLFQAGNYKKMAEYIIRLWDSQSLRKRISLHARINVKKYGWDSIHQKIYGFLEG
jgi:glycosyltransferase involved in cell wall biosynthesis